MTASFLFFISCAYTYSKSRSLSLSSTCVSSHSLSSDWFTTEDIIKALKEYAENGVPEFIPSAEMDPVQALHDSIKKMPDGTISYKQSGKRGSKSCMFDSEEEFVAFVSDAETRLPLIKDALESAYKEMQANAEDEESEEVDEESVSEE